MLQLVLRTNNKELVEDNTEIFSNDTLDRGMQDGNQVVVIYILPRLSLHVKKYYGNPSDVRASFEQKKQITMFEQVLISPFPLF